jgi:hypothetical protein
MAASHPVERAGVETHQRNESETQPRKNEIQHGVLLWRIAC